MFHWCFGIVNGSCQLLRRVSDLKILIFVFIFRSCSKKFIYKILTVLFCVNRRRYFPISVNTFSLWGTWAKFFHFEVNFFINFNLTYAFRKMSTYILLLNLYLILDSIKSIKSSLEAKLVIVSRSAQKYDLVKPQSHHCRIYILNGVSVRFWHVWQELSVSFL